MRARGRKPASVFILSQGLLVGADGSAFQRSFLLKGIDLLDEKYSMLAAAPQANAAAMSQQQSMMYVFANQNALPVALDKGEKVENRIGDEEHTAATGHMANEAEIAGNMDGSTAGGKAAERFAGSNPQAALLVAVKGAGKSWPMGKVFCMHKGRRQAVQLCLQAGRLHRAEDEKVAAGEGDALHCARQGNAAVKTALGQANKVKLAVCSAANSQKTGAKKAHILWVNAHRQGEEREGG